ncbi:MAG: DUF542 domain-containing protein [Candidatus Hydrothermarchaeales archaeon]
MGITQDMKVGDVMRNHPNTRSIFMRHGICNCCGGELSIEKTARAKNLDLGELIKNLNATL